MRITKNTHWWVQNTENKQKTLKSLKSITTLNASRMWNAVITFANNSLLEFSFNCIKFDWIWFLFFFYAIEIFRISSDRFLISFSKLFCNPYRRHLLINSETVLHFSSATVKHSCPLQTWKPYFVNIALCRWLVHNFGGKEHVSDVRLQKSLWNDVIFAWFICRHSHRVESPDCNTIHVMFFRTFTEWHPFEIEI